LAFDVPWEALPPQPFAYISPRQSPPSPRQARPCERQDISASQAQSAGISQTGDFSVIFHNISASACWLRGYPTSVIAVSPGGGIRRLSLPHLPRLPDGLSAPMRPGAISYLAIDTGTACADSSLRQATRYTRLVIGVARGQIATRTPDGGAIFVCGLGVHPFSIPAPTADIAGTDAALAADIFAPLTVRAGTTLRYVVRLSNLSRKPVPLASCPSYRELVATSGPGPPAQADYQLNCSTTDAVPALGHVTFEMRLVIPATTAPGDAKFIWSFTQGQPATSHGLTVQPHD
jgi:hypothetical protein